MATANKLTVAGVYHERETSAIDGDSDPILTYDVSVAEAERLVKVSKGRRFSVHAQQFAVKMDQSGVVEGTTRGREVTSYVNTNRTGVLRFIEGAYRNSREGFYVRVSFSKYCFFIG